MTSNRQFTYYNSVSEKVLQLTTNNDTGIFAFIIYNSNLQLSDLEYPDNIRDDLETDQYDLGNNKYNLLFRYKPSGTYTTSTFNKKWIFFTTGDDLDPNLTVDWVNSTTNLGNIQDAQLSGNPDQTTSGFSNTHPENWNRETIAESGGSSGGDPHIKPYFNLHNKVYMLPTNDCVYKYFDTQDPSERIIINTQMHLLSFDLIVFAEELKIKRQGRNNWDKVPQAIENITKYPKTMETKEDHDTSFAKYISVMYQSRSKKEQLMIDVESLEIVEDKRKDETNKIDVSSIKETDAKHYKSKKSDIKNIKMREITISSKKLDTITLLIYRDYDRLNHRSHISLLFKNHNTNYLHP